MPQSRTIRFFTPLALVAGTTLVGIQPRAALALAARQEAGPPGSPLIDHDPVECVVEQRHPLFRASVATAEGLHTVKLYFHAQDYNDYYYVEMVDRGSGAYEASLPIASPETEAFVYYIEAVDLLFNTSRTEEYVTRVASDQDCDSEEGPPPIVVGSTAPGAAVIPPGFAATGIERFISSTGATTGIGGGGLGTVGIAAIGGGVAAGVTAGVLGGGDEEPAPDPPAPPPPTPGPPEPPEPPEPTGSDPVACFHTDPNPPVVDINESIRFDASCSTADEPLALVSDKIEKYHWRFNDGKADKEGRVVNHVYARAGSYFATLTVTDSVGNTNTMEVEVIVRDQVAPPSGGGGGGGGPGPPPPPDANLGCSISGPSSAAAGNVNLTVNVSNAGPLVAANAVLTINCSQPITSVSGGFTSCNQTGPGTARCGPNSLPIGSASVGFVVSTSVSFVCRADISSSTPDNTPGNNSDGHNVSIPQRSPDLIPDLINTSFVSRLDVPPGDGSVRGQVLLNGSSLQETNNTAPFRHQVQGQEGRNTVEARVVVGNGEGRWVFDFGSSPHFVAGSLAVESGQVIVQEGSRIVFRVSPSAPPIRFRYRLSD
jgi:PKD repeat protein